MYFFVFSVLIKERQVVSIKVVSKEFPVTFPSLVFPSCKESKEKSRKLALRPGKGRTHGGKESLD